ncbi:unnamed protein product, partial [Phaeothamnion confervicola]
MWACSGGGYGSYGGKDMTPALLASDFVLVVPSFATGGSESVLRQTWFVGPPVTVLAAARTTHATSGAPDAAAEWEATTANLATFRFRTSDAQPWPDDATPRFTTAVGFLDA